MSNPVLAEVWRGEIVESFHCGAVCVTGPDGDVIFEIGDTGRAIYPRSAIKILQALPLVESGAVDTFGFGDGALALACASHNGEARHVEQASAMLTACGQSVGALECGVQNPMGSAALWDLAHDHGRASALHNNCSGKHAGMIATAVHLGEDPAGYVSLEHPVQRRIHEVLGEMTDTALDVAPCGVDGCSVPTWAMPLDKMAQAMSRLVTGDRCSVARARAAARLVSACLAEPEMTSGTGRRCGQIMVATKRRAYVKTGAEGVYCGAVPELGVGIALKVDDGGKRAAETAVSAVVAALLPDRADGLADYCNVTLRNWRGIDVGVLRPSAELLSGLAVKR